MKPLSVINWKLNQLSQSINKVSSHHRCFFCVSSSAVGLITYFIDANWVYPLLVLTCHFTWSKHKIWGYYHCSDLNSIFTVTSSGIFCP